MLYAFFFETLNSLEFLLFTFIPPLGRFVFAYDSSIASEGSNATFTCQDTESKFPFKITWSFQSAFVGRMICKNGSIAPEINNYKYQLLKSSTKLRITDLKVNDTGNYTCCIEGENGETLLSATATLYVKGKLANPFLCCSQMSAMFSYVSYQLCVCFCYIRRCIYNILARCVWLRLG